jgi:FlaA1/EpsC-like NDP-sugar epimerase
MPDGRDLSRLQPAELLGRVELCPSLFEAAAGFAGRRVLITGAGGSVGPELTASLTPVAEQVVLVDHHEASLWQLHRRFGDLPTVQLLLTDIRNPVRVADALRRWQPELIFHLAAYKHVPFGEVFSDETFSVNVLGTSVLLEMAVEAGVERFVYPSSDKSCDPPSLYGATKRLAEVLVRKTAERHGQRYNVARFVNILGTRGSVIETFAQQVQQGRPLTVTDPDMTRYWISMNEAIWLLLSAAGLERGGQTLMLDTPEEVPVVEMARRVCQLLLGDRDACEISFGSPRDGERLREKLLSASERFVETPRAGLLTVVDDRSAEHLARIEPLLDQLTSLAGSSDVDELRAAVMGAAGALQ